MTPPDTILSLLRVRLGDAVLALPATAVREIVRAVAITALPGAPAIIEGAVNVRGALVPVVDVRARLRLPARALDPDQFLVMLQAGDRTVALRVDEVDDLVDVSPREIEGTGTLSPAMQGLAGLSARADGMLVIYDPAAFVSQAESQALDAALAAHA
ncbi:MAG: cheW [Gemmatimonadetes bacterium]|jgi:purine-binding chemotaxis protein CheW|nr:cheW [Gemmatimonadota bacterium]